MISPSLIERYLFRQPRGQRPTSQERRAAAIANEEPIVLRRAVTADGLTLARLQQLDGRTLPKGDRVVAQVGGEVVAAAHVPSGAAVSDPFVPTAAIVELLTQHARRLRPEVMA